MYVNFRFLMYIINIILRTTDASFRKYKVANFGVYSVQPKFTSVNTELPYGCTKQPISITPS